MQWQSGQEWIEGSRVYATNASSPVSKEQVSAGIVGDFRSDLQPLDGEQVCRRSEYTGMPQEEQEK